MVDKPTGDDLTGHSIEWVTDMVNQWIEANETAQALQRGLPQNYQRQLWAIPLGHHGLAGAMAMSMNPQTIYEAHEWLLSARAQLQEVGSLSHPERMIGPKTAAEIGARMTEAEVERLEARIEELERDRDRLLGVLRMVEALSASGVDGGEQRPPQVLRNASGL